MNLGNFEFQPRDTTRVRYLMQLEYIFVYTYIHSDDGKAAAAAAEQAAKAIHITGMERIIKCSFIRTYVRMCYRTLMVAGALLLRSVNLCYHLSDRPLWHRHTMRPNLTLFSFSFYLMPYSYANAISMRIHHHRTREFTQILRVTKERGGEGEKEREKLAQQRKIKYK